MSLLQFFNTYGEAIIGLTLIFLLLTYWVLIYRIFKLEQTMRTFDKRFGNLENLFKAVSENVVLIVNNFKKLEMLKTAKIKFNATTPIGPIDAEIDLSKAFQKKQELKRKE